MKYFTPDWHSGEIDDDAHDSAVEDYRRHLASLLPGLPPDVQTLAADINLHDGLIRQIVSNPQQPTLLLSLCCGDNRVGYFNLDLYYSQVFFLPSEQANLSGLEAEKKSTAMYDELDIEAGVFVHRILFLAPYVPPLMQNRYHEISIHFERLQMVTTPCDSPYNAKKRKRHVSR